MPTEDGVILPAGSSMGGEVFAPTINLVGHQWSKDEAQRQLMAELNLMFTMAQR